MKKNKIAKVKLLALQTFFRKGELLGTAIDFSQLDHYQLGRLISDLEELYRLQIRTTAVRALCEDKND